jgi:cytochrome c oxidase subunit 3
MDHRSPIWWGNILLLVIETTMFALLIATYLYFRVVDFDQWPPPRVNRVPVIYHPLPSLTIATINLAVILVSFGPMFWVDRACLKRNETAVKLGLVVCILFGVAAIILRFYEFPAIQFKWNDNAYAGVVWTILGMHLAHLITATCENAVMAAWLFAKGMDFKHARDVRVTATYWYWVVGIWVILYVLVYWVPRWT